MKRHVLKYLILIIPIFFLISCVPLKKVYYLRENKKDTANYIKVAPKYIIRPGDMLYIKIFAFDEKNTQLFNTISSNFSYYMNEQLSINLNSYTVNDSGYIVMPLFEKIHIDSLTIEQAQEKIRTKVKSFITGADVVVKLLSFKITFIGEFNKPGNYVIYNSNINIFEAISLAGELTPYGDKSKLTIIRQLESGKIYKVDLTDRSVIYSDIFYLKPNDILYVEPLKIKRQLYSNTTMASISLFLASFVNLIFLINYFN